MFDKKKLNFWRLAAIFTGLIVITLFSLWISPHGTKAEMMNSSMGNMAKDMHLSDVTIYDLLSQPESEQTAASTSDSHHEGEASEVKTMGIVSSVIIFSLLPLIIGGSIILAIVWIK